MGQQGMVRKQIPLVPASFPDGVEKFKTNGTLGAITRLYGQDEDFVGKRYFMGKALNFESFLREHNQALLGMLAPVW